MINNIKWIFYLTVCCAIADLFLFPFSMHQNEDVMFPGLILIPLLLGVVYTGVCVFWIRKKEVAGKMPTFSYLLLGPPLLYLAGHLVLLALWLLRILGHLL